MGTGLHVAEEDCARAWDSYARKLRKEYSAYDIFPEHCLNFPGGVKIHSELAHLKPMVITEADLVRPSRGSTRSFGGGNGGEKKRKLHGSTGEKGAFYDKMLHGEEVLDSADLANRPVNTNSLHKTPELKLTFSFLLYYNTPTPSDPSSRLYLRPPVNPTCHCIPTHTHHTHTPAVDPQYSNRIRLDQHV